MKWFWRGALIAILGSFPLAVVCAVVYRFPVPLVGMRSGVDAIPAALFAVLAYGILGGFVVQGLLGGLGGVVAAKVNREVSPATDRMCVVLSLLAASVGVLTLVFLDRIIGPW